MDSYILLVVKLKKKYPKYQYMGMFKLKKGTFFLLNKFFKKIKKPKIDMTSFLDASIKEKKIKFKIKKFKSYWLEIDNEKDLNVASKELKI